MVSGVFSKRKCLHFLTAARAVKMHWLQPLIDNNTPTQVIDSFGVEMTTHCSKLFWSLLS